jgi:hypothetical protein
LIFAAYRPQEPLITFEVYRNDSYIRELRRKEKDFIKELESHGHKIQSEFRGYQVGKASKSIAKPEKRIFRKSDKPEWRFEEGLLRFWDGSDYLEGEDPGLYELSGENHYWDGEQWWVPEEVGLYDLNGIEIFWDGNCWEM